jgi:hypothetical protein
MSSTSEERRDHCIKDHKFPHDFRFDKVASKKKSLSSDRMDTGESEPNLQSTKPKAIKNFHFGHKSQKVFKSTKKTDPLESMAVDMKESLPDV